MNKVKRVLGIDPGISSVGWALIEENEKNATKFIDGGSVIFKPVFETPSFGLKNQKRSEKRQIRRQRERSKRRLSKVENFLIKHGLLSHSVDLFHFNKQSIQATLANPYQLRSEGLSRLLSGDELSYAILHLFRRRGFYSALKSKTAEQKKKEAQQQGIMEQMREAGFQTLGQYFWHSLSRNSNVKIRANEERLLRDNLYEELELILDKQIELGNSALLSVDNKTNQVVRDELLRQFLFQRPLKGQKRRTFCSLEKKVASFQDNKKNSSKEKNEKNIKTRKIGLKTAHKFTVYGQEFLIRQKLNNLKVKERDENGFEFFNIDISDENRENLFDIAWKNEELSIEDIRKELNVSKYAKINLKCIQGNELLKLFKGDLKQWFNELTISEQHYLMTDIHMIKGLEFIGLRKRLISYWGLTNDFVDSLISSINQKIRPEYLSISKKAIDKLLPELRKGALFHEAKETIYGKFVENEIETSYLLPEFPLTTNPIVNKSIVEVRKIVNSVIKKHGKIDVIRLELARDIGLSSKGLSELQKKQKKQEKDNLKAKAFLEEKGLFVNKTNIEKYKLWQEIKEDNVFPEKKDGKWVYSKISFHELFDSNGTYEIEHLFPISESGDNSFMNKSLCKASVNGAKGQRTPYDYYLSVMTNSELETWINHINETFKGNSKKTRFLMTGHEMRENLSSSSSLNDTRYIATLLKDHLALVAETVEPTKGGYTAMIRRELDLNKLLGNSAKKSRLDYRHHMVDALAVSMTSRSTLDLLTKIRKMNSYEVYSKNKSKRYLEVHNKINQRYSAIRKAFEIHFENTFTQHEVENKPSGGFDEETIYTLMRKKSDNVSPCGNYTYTTLNKVDVNAIKDVAELDDSKYDDCVFVTSKPASDMLNGKTAGTILDLEQKGKIYLPLEVIQILHELPKEHKVEETITLNSGNALKKVKVITAKPSDSNICHTVRNKEKQVIGFKKLGNNFCVVGFNKGEPRVVSLFEYLNSKELDKTDVIFKGTILEDREGQKWKVYKFSGSNICIHPVNFIKIDNNSFKTLKLNKSYQNIIEKSFSYYIKNFFNIVRSK